MSTNTKPTKTPSPWSTFPAQSLLDLMHDQQGEYTEWSDQGNIPQEGLLDQQYGFIVIPPLNIWGQKRFALKLGDGAADNTPCTPCQNARHGCSFIPRKASQLTPQKRKKQREEMADIDVIVPSKKACLEASAEEDGVESELLKALKQLIIIQELVLKENERIRNNTDWMASALDSIFSNAEDRTASKTNWTFLKELLERIESQIAG
ncbi:hypothetical protein BDQ17DRAFT_1339520 [Cyathus striatus]|nr:hypothetical protein BDQ17DRAFT_1339520 [Cyathus striatus]